MGSFRGGRCGGRASVAPGSAPRSAGRVIWLAFQVARFAVLTWTALRADVRTAGGEFALMTRKPASGVVSVSSPDSDGGIEESPVEILHLVTMGTRYDLLQNIVGHPLGAPSLEELTYMSGRVNNKSTVLEHLEKLMDAGVVGKATLPEDQRERDLPRTFYYVTDEGLEFLQDHGLLRNVEVLRQIYRATEKPDKIKRFQSAPRPPSISGGNDDDENVDEIMAVLEEYKETGDPEEAARRLRELQDEDAVEDKTSRMFLGCQLQRLRSATARVQKQVVMKIREELKRVRSTVERFLLQRTRH